MAILNIISPVHSRIVLLAFLFLVSDGLVAVASTVDLASTYNGRALTDLLVEKCANANDDEARCRFKTAVEWLENREIVIQGSVAEVSSRWFSSGKSVVITVGRARDQAVNVKLCVRSDAGKSVSSLRIGQEVAFRCRVSAKMDLLNDLVLVDATPVDVHESRKALNEARTNLDGILGECLVPESSFGLLAASRRYELMEMARCANAAYPEKSLPLGYRAMSRQEWERAVGECGYSLEVYSDDGYVIFGNGLRGRLLVHRLLNRVVIAWSGCDLSCRDVRLAGGLDFVTCARHLLSGSVESQFEQALSISEGVARNARGSVWIVGHSLGGCLTTYVALKMDEMEGKDILCATFNGLGVAMPFVRELSKEACNRGARRLANVFCTKDPVYNGHRVTSWTGYQPHHFGRSYFIEYQDGPKELGLIDQLIQYHGMDELCNQMRLLCPWYKDRGLLVWLLSAVFLVLVVCGVVCGVSGMVCRKSVRNPRKIFLA